MREFVALDLETTGLDPERDRVIEVGAVVFTYDAVGATLERLTDPGRTVPEAVLRLTGISPQDLVGAAPAEAVMGQLAGLLPGRQPVGHGARLDVDFLVTAGLWPAEQEILDTLDVARILMPCATSHSLPVLAAELGLAQPRPHRALDDADATRQLLLRLRNLAADQDEDLKAAMLTLVAPYGWAIASFFAEALTATLPPLPRPDPALASMAAGRGRAIADDSPAALAGLLAPDGPLAALPGYEHREAQLQMLLAVAQIMRRGGRLVVEAGTGTGKSLAYLVPALARAVGRGERVVVSTHTHTLQEQLVLRDIPALRQWLPWDFEACLLKGRSNYVSLRRWRRYLAEPCRDAKELEFKLKILVWLEQTRTGDRAELRLQGTEESYWSRIASDPLDCVGLHCTEASCFVHRARAQAERADLVVVNHALLLADASTSASLIPAYEHLVVDEAHHLEDSATQSLRCDVDGPALEGLLRRLVADGDGRRAGLLPGMRLQPHLGESADALAEAELAATAAATRCAELFQAAVEWSRRQLPEETTRRDEAVRLVPEHRERADWPALAGLAGDAVTALAALDARLRNAVALSRDWLGGQEPDQDLRELEIIRGRLAEAADLLHQAFRQPDPNRVYWTTVPPRTGVLLLRSAPLEIGPMLRERVFAERGSVVMTSASLAVAGSFDYFCSRVGLGAEVETLLLPSPFDYLAQALVCLPADLPEPGSEDFDLVVEDIVADVAGRLRGRTLALFTSHHQLRNVYAGLKHRRDLDEVLILGQGIDGQRRHVLRAFEENERPLLLGTSSFWEGVDIPGDRLSCVVIVRLPFHVPTEPVYAARAERLRDPFLQYALPQAALRLKQGFGRLIRRHDDRGAVVILDSRVLERDYGRAFLEALPPASRSLGPAEEVGQRIEEWVGPAGR
jgi:DNA polymerase-3 subunit epsilon/ATP-dependent DNA helicase DinG